MNVKNALQDECNNCINFLNRLIADLQACNDNLINIPESWMFNRANQRKFNDSEIEKYRDEIVELEELRDGYITVEQLGTARRFFNKMPAWGTYGT